MAPNNQSQISFPCRKQSVRRKMDFDLTDTNDPVCMPSPTKSPRKDFSRDLPESCPRHTRSAARLQAAASPLRVSARLLAASPMKSASVSNVASPVKCLLSPTKAKLPVTPKKTPRKQNENEENQEAVPAIRSSPRKIKVQPPDVSNFVKARQALHTAVPTTITCRDKELAVIETFIKDHVDGKKPGSMYISGRPGTGKTACVNHVLNNRAKVCKFKSIFINCMTLQSPTAIYTQIAKQLDSKASITSKEALSFLEEKVTERGPMIVLVLDEIDQMTTRDQTVLYSLFELPALNDSRLVLIGLANSLDLTDRALVRLQSRVQFKPVLLNFPPYSKQQIAEILSQRLQEAVSGEAASVVAPSALQYLGGKISASSGDLRKAIDVCRRAVELAESTTKKQMVLTSASDSNSTKAKCVSIPMLCNLINSVESSRFCSSEAGQGDADETPLQQRVIIVALLVLVQHGRSKQVTLGKLHETYSKICSKFNVTAMDFDEMVHTCSLIEARGVLTIKKTKKANNRLSAVALRLDQQEVEQTLKDKTLLSSILAQGPSFV